MVRRSQLRCGEAPVSAEREAAGNGEPGERLDETSAQAQEVNLVAGKQGVSSRKLSGFDQCFVRPDKSDGTVFGSARIAIRRR